MHRTLDRSNQQRAEQANAAEQPKHAVSVLACQPVRGHERSGDELARTTGTYWPVISAGDLSA
eukprot:SAG31_NODE_322_length_17726_cov_18.070006_16_plen_63_part_00